MAISFRLIEAFIGWSRNGIIPPEVISDCLRLFISNWQNNTRICNPNAGIGMQSLNNTWVYVATAIDTAQRENLLEILLKLRTKRGWQINGLYLPIQFQPDGTPIFWPAWQAWLGPFDVESGDLC